MNGIIFLNADQNILLYKSHEVLVPPRYPGNIGISIQWTTHAHITKKKKTGAIHLRNSLRVTIYIFTGGLPFTRSPHKIFLINVILQFSHKIEGNVLSFPTVVAKTHIHLPAPYPEPNLTLNF